MVSYEERRSPTYSLTQCKSAVSQRRYRLSRAATNFISDLAASDLHITFDTYDFEAFVQSLNDKHFNKSICYGSGKSWMDVYMADYELRVGDEYSHDRTIHLYFKFCMSNNQMYLQTISFHEDR